MKQGHTLSGRLALVVLALLIPVSALGWVRTKGRATLDFEPPQPNDWGLSDSFAGTGLDAVMMLERVLIDDSELKHGNCFRSVYQRIRILNDNGRRFGEVQIPLIDSAQEIIEIRARAIDRDGTITELSDEHIHRVTLVKTEDLEIVQTTFSLPGVSSDCIVEYIYVYALPIASGSVEIQKDLPLLRGEYQWKLGEFKMRRGMREILQWLGPMYDITQANFLWLNPHGRQEYHKTPESGVTKELLFTSTAVPAFRSEPQSVPDRSLRERLFLYYGSTSDAMTYWAGCCLAAWRSQEAFARKNEKVKELAKRFEHIPSATAKIDSVYYWIQDSIVNTTYGNLGDDRWWKLSDKERFKAHSNVDEVLADRYGNSIEISSLFCEIVNQLGIDSRLCFVKDRSVGLLLSEAKMWQFDNSMVAVSFLGNVFRFYSPGYPCTPPDIVPWQFEGVSALMAKEGLIFFTVPLDDERRSTVTSVAEFEISPDLDIHGSFHSDVTGQFARTARLALLKMDTAKFADEVQASLERKYQSSRITAVTPRNVTTTHVPLEITFEADFPRLAVTGDKVLLNPLHLLSSNENPFTAGERTNPILMDHAYQIKDSATFRIPEGWTVEALPHDTLFANVVGRCELRTAASGDLLTVMRKVTLLAPAWEASQYPLVKGFFEARQAVNNALVILARTPVEQ